MVANGLHHCDYLGGERGIHQFIFHLPSREAVDVWLGHLGRIYDATPKGAEVNLLLDCSTSGVLPMMYVVQAGRAFITRYPFRPFTRIASVHQPNTALHMIQPMLNLLKINHTYDLRFFFERESALNWLRGGLPLETPARPVIEEQPPRLI
jgi:hypothetical protein